MGKKRKHKGSSRPMRWTDNPKVAKKGMGMGQWQHTIDTSKELDQFYISSLIRDIADEKRFKDQ